LNTLASGLNITISPALSQQKAALKGRGFKPINFGKNRRDFLILVMGVGQNSITHHQSPTSTSDV
jgi:hypothetical protein